MRHIRLELAVDVEHKKVEALATLSLTALQTAGSVSFDAADFDVIDVRASRDGAAAGKARFANSGTNIEVFFDAPVPSGKPVTIEIQYRLSDPKNGLHFFAPSPETPDAPFQVWSQGQSEENHFWFPCFDHPSEMQTTELIVAVDSRFSVLSNGTLKSKKAATGDGKTVFHWVQEQPHVTYLVTLVIGEFAVKEDTWRGKPLLYYVPPKRQADIDRSFANTPRMLDYFSDKIGVEYPWPKYAQVCCHTFGGGMENTSATTLGDRTLHDERAHLDGDSDGLVAHELAHQWFGDLLTCRDWAHLWLNEGFASYFEALWDEKHLGDDEFAYNMYEKAKSAIAGGKQLPIVHRAYTNPDQQFDSRAYPKGAWVLHMIRRRLGDEQFWKVIEHYVKSHRHQTVATSDFRDAVEQISGRNFERFFYDWTERPGHPLLNVAMKWNEAEKLAEVTVKQIQETDAFEFPLTLEFTTEAGKPITITREIREKQSLILAPLPARPTLMRVDPGNTVLKELTEDKPRDMWIAQLTTDADPIGRILAARALGKNKTDANRTALADALRSERFWAVAAEICGTLGEMGEKTACDSLIEATRHAHPKVRRAAVDALSKFTDENAAREAVEKILSAGDASYRVEAAAISALGKLAPAAARPALERCLEKPSEDEMLRSAALRALGDQDDPSIAAMLLQWASVDRPRECRGELYEAIGDSARRAGVEGAVLDRAVAFLSKAAESRDRRPAGAAIRALGEFGRRAEAALPALRRVAARADDRGGRAAREAIEKIEKDAPSQGRLNELTRKIGDLEKENQSLRDRMQTLEAKKSAEQTTASVP